MKSEYYYAIYTKKMDIIRNNIKTKKELISQIIFLKKNGYKDFHCIKRFIEIDDSNKNINEEEECVAYIKHGKTVMLNNKPNLQTILDILNDNETYDENLSNKIRSKSKYFNMIEICNIAKVNYLLYEEWLTKGKMLSDKRLSMILDAMKKVAE